MGYVVSEVNEEEVHIALAEKRIIRVAIHFLKHIIYWKTPDNHSDVSLLC